MSCFPNYFAILNVNTQSCYFSLYFFFPYLNQWFSDWNTEPCKMIYSNVVYANRCLSKLHSYIEYGINNVQLIFIHIKLLFNAWHCHIIPPTVYNVPSGGHILSMHPFLFNIQQKQHSVRCSLNMWCISHTYMVANIQLC